MLSYEIGVTMNSASVLNVIGDTMREVPKSTLPDEALDNLKCLEAIETSLERPEPVKAFDRNA